MLKCDLNHISVALGETQTALMHFLELVKFLFIWTAAARKKLHPWRHYGLEEQKGKDHLVKDKHLYDTLFWLEIKIMEFMRYFSSFPKAMTVLLSFFWHRIFATEVTLPLFKKCNFQLQSLLKLDIKLIWFLFWSTNQTTDNTGSLKTFKRGPYNIRCNFLFSSCFCCSAPEATHNIYLALLFLSTTI